MRGVLHQGAPPAIHRAELRAPGVGARVSTPRRLRVRILDSNVRPAGEKPATSKSMLPLCAFSFTLAVVA